MFLNRISSAEIQHVHEADQLFAYAHVYRSAAASISLALVQQTGKCHEWLACRSLFSLRSQRRNYQRLTPSPDPA